MRSLLIPATETSTKTVAIVQSCYIPWRGYFDLISRVDEFVLYDDVQYTRRDWRNRNQIKTAQGLKWLTIPVDVKGKYHQKIKDTRIADPAWADNHWQSIRHAYGKAACFGDRRTALEELYLGCRETFLSMVNYRFITGINSLLGIGTRISWSSDYRLDGEKTERLLSICKQAGATHYLSGPSAKSYLDEALFRRRPLAWKASSRSPLSRSRPPGASSFCRAVALRRAI